jgi:hypothetical protein
VTELPENGILILGSLIAEEDVQRAIIDCFGPSNQLIRLLLGNLPYNEGWDDPMLRSES